MRRQLAILGVVATALLSLGACVTPDDPSFDLHDEDVDQPAQGIKLCPNHEPPPCEVPDPPEPPPDPDDPPPPPPRDPSVPRTPGLSTLKVDIGLVNQLFDRLDGTMISVDTTKGAPPIYTGTATVCHRPAGYDEAIAECNTWPKKYRAQCVAEVNEAYPMQCGTVADDPKYSYIAFPASVKSQIPELTDVAFDLEPFSKDTWYGLLTISLNQLRTVFGQQQASLFSGGFYDGSAFLGLNIDVVSGSPTVICSRDGILPCPDVRLYNMKLSVSLYRLQPDGNDPTRITFGAANASLAFDRDVNNAPEWFVDQWYDLDTKIKTKVRQKLVNVINERKEGLSKLLTAVVNKYAVTLNSSFTGFKRIDEVTAQGQFIYVHYEPNP